MTYIDVLLKAVAESGRSNRAISIAAVGHDGAVRGLKRGLDLRVSTAQALCRELDLEFHIGPRRPAVSPEIARALKLGNDCSIKDAIDAIESLADTMSAVQARAKAIFEPVADENRRGFMKEIERLARERDTMVNLRDAIVPVNLAMGVRIVEDTGRIEFLDAEMSVSFPLSRVPGWASHDDLILIRASGNSMEPDLSDGDMILLDRSKNGPVSGQVFLMRSADGLTVRRLLQTAGPWLLFGVDESSPERMLAPGDQLVGAVVWSGRRNPLFTPTEIKPIQ